MCDIFSLRAALCGNIVHWFQKTLWLSKNLFYWFEMHTNFLNDKILYSYRNLTNKYYAVKLLRHIFHLHLTEKWKAHLQEPADEQKLETGMKVKNSMLLLQFSTVPVSYKVKSVIDLRMSIHCHVLWRVFIKQTRTSRCTDTERKTVTLF